MKKTISIITAFFVLLSMATIVYATPALQLDIVGGTYENSSQTIIAPSNVFTLNALLIPDNQGANTVSDNYFLSAALINTSLITGSFGTFIINGITYNANLDMDFGAPPVDALYPDLASHGIFDSYYKEISFMFPSTPTYLKYNVQDNPGTTPIAGDDMFVKGFSIDISGLAAGLGIHFDLYNENIKASNGNYMTEFAPFSHDAEGRTTVPEPGTFILLGAGLLGLAAYGRKRIRK